MGAEQEAAFIRELQVYQRRCPCAHQVHSQAGCPQTRTGHTAESVCVRVVKMKEAHLPKGEPF